MARTADGDCPGTMAEADFRSVGVRECGERAVVVKGRASSAERGLLFGRFGTAIVSADGGIGISDLVFPKNDVTFVRNKSNSKE